MKLRHTTVYILLFMASSPWLRANTIPLKNAGFEQAPVQMSKTGAPFNNAHYNRLTEIQDWGLPATNKADKDFSYALMDGQNWHHTGIYPKGFSGKQMLWLLSDSKRATQKVNHPLIPGKTYSFSLSIASWGNNPGAISIRIESVTGVLAEEIVKFSAHNPQLKEYRVIFDNPDVETDQFIVSFGIRNRSDNIFIFDNARLEEFDSASEMSVAAANSSKVKLEKPAALIGIGRTVLTLSPKIKSSTE